MIFLRALRGECLLLLYYITDRTAFAADEPTRRRRLLEKIHEAAIVGIDYIQLREKDLSTRDLESLAREAVTAIREARPTVHYPRSTALLINSRTDVALAVGADGVHLRSEDVSVEEGSAIWKKSVAGQCGADNPFDQLSAGFASQLAPLSPQIAVSCHSSAEVGQAAASGATLAVFGPVFEKEDVKPIGLGTLHESCKAAIPVLALGGVTLSNAHSCLEAGASGIAAIRLFQENEIAEIVKILRNEKQSS